jgi:hypothetical protein
MRTEVKKIVSGYQPFQFIEDYWNLMFEDYYYLILINEIFSSEQKIVAEKLTLNQTFIIRQNICSNGLI